MKQLEESLIFHALRFEIEMVKKNIVHLLTQKVKELEIDQLVFCYEYGENCIPSICMFHAK